MREEPLGLVIGISVGVVIGVALAIVAFFCIGHLGKRRRIPIADSSPKSTSRGGLSLWPRKGRQKPNVIPGSGILEYSYKDLEKATCNFTSLIGQGAFGPVYRAQMSTGQKQTVVAVKVLAKDSRQGEKEFQTEIRLLGRLHHRNLVNLVGYCVEKQQHMLVYVYMCRGSLASHLYSEELEPLKWELRIKIALDVARALEYLHDGVVPSVIHCDIKSSNVLLDESMRARVADFGLSREETASADAPDIQGTFGYVDPHCITTRSFSKKSDVYSFGVLLFELIAGRNPLQGLMEYVELVAMSSDGKVGWDELGDPRLQGKYKVEEVNEMGDLAQKCVSRDAVKRPWMRDIVQLLSRILNRRSCGSNQELVVQFVCQTPPPPHSGTAAGSIDV